MEFPLALQLIILYIMAAINFCACYLINMFISYFCGKDQPGANGMQVEEGKGRQMMLTPPPPLYPQLPRNRRDLYNYG